MNQMKNEKLKEFGKALGGQIGQKLCEQAWLVEQGHCPICGKSGPFQFKDALSKREFGISGMCQACQDEIFVEME